MNLPEVTLVMTDTRCHELARLAVLDCMEQVDFGEVLICSDRDFKMPGTTWYYVDDWPDKDKAQEFLWRDLPFMINTTHYLFCEWDAWILDGSKWNNDFLNYDFIGAPWSWLETNSIGNGGFSLRSTRMAQHIARRSDAYPIKYPFRWDELLCQTYRPMLEREGFVWPRESLARQFAFETRRDRFDTFGFHAMFNWPLVISGDRLKQRIEAACRTDHVQRTQRKNLELLLC